MHLWSAGRPACNNVRLLLFLCFGGVLPFDLTYENGPPIGALAQRGAMGSRLRLEAPALRLLPLPRVALRLGIFVRSVRKGEAAVDLAMRIGG